MTSKKSSSAVTRIWVNSGLVAGKSIPASASQSHHLRHVLRVGDGTPVAVFNGTDGEWLARVRFTGRKLCTLDPVQLVRPQVSENGPWLLFAPVKKYRLDYLVQKAVELGVELIRPVRTRRTVVRRIGEDRLLANATEAAEQCGRLTRPRIDEFSALPDVIAGWSSRRTLFWGDESGGGVPALKAFGGGVTQAAFLIGPEGGFELCERNLLGAQPFAKAIDLGPRILRSDTAGLMALSLWQGMRSASEV
jgi:16S rRNA (uracil1498-N3)-methyltransferase